MEREVIQILADYGTVPADKIHPDSTLQQDLKLNSLDVINLVVEFEDRFNIEIQEADIRSFQTVQDLVDYLNAQVPVAQTAHA